MTVPKEYRVIGSEESPYSVKVRSYFRYKSLPHQWLTRNQAGDLFQTHAKLPLVPLVVTPGAGSELYRGLGSVVVGGLVLSAILTLLIVPPMMTVLARKPRKREDEPREPVAAEASAD